MVQPTAEVARVIGAVAKGDLSQSMTVEIDGRPLRGEFLRIGKVVNTMVEQLASFASEVTAWRARSAPRASSAARRR
jgi:methyl-accepting chemotaxis protein